jgi:double-strand break repair protein MRE11
VPEESVLAELSNGNVKVDKLVREFLTAQTLTILPQNSFGDAVLQFVDKDDKHAMELFVEESLSGQLKHLMEANELDEADIITEMDQYKSQLENMFAAGKIKKTKRSNLKAKPFGWDSDEDGHWADDPGALIRQIDDEEENGDDANDASVASVTTKKPAARGRGKAAGTTRPSAAAAKKTAPAAKGGRGKRKVVEEEEEEEEDDDVIMLSDNDEESDEGVFVPEVKKKAPARKPAAKAPARAKSPAKKTTITRAKAPAAGKQSTLNFSQSATQRSQPTRTPVARGRKVAEPVSRHPAI